MQNHNPTGIRGIEFIEFSATPEQGLDELFVDFGFSKTMRHRHAEIDFFQQNQIRFLLNQTDEGFAADFRHAHGPSICGMGLRVDDARQAFETAVERGARPWEPDQGTTLDFDVPAVYGIGDSLIYFLDDAHGFYTSQFAQHDEPTLVPDKGFLTIDHLTNNVYKGTLEEWSNFYKDIFGFTEVRHFDIRGEKTGLFSYALRSPDGSFCIPINEGTEEKSQIEEYLREYHGPGIQHIAFASRDLLASLDAMTDTQIEFLDIDDLYYENVFDRVPDVTESHERIQQLQVLVDGDEEGYLLQIFTKNVVGPIFIELIQRKNHQSFGEGNFGALFRSIERDQEKRGVL